MAIGDEKSEHLDGAASEALDDSPLASPRRGSAADSDGESPVKQAPELDEKSHLESAAQDGRESQGSARSQDDPHTEDVPVPTRTRTRTRSRASRRSQSHGRNSSVFSRTLAPVPRAERRGLFSRFAIIPEIGRPYDYKNSTKWTITAIVALAGAAAPVGSSIFYPALPEMAIDLNATPTVTNLSVALYMLAMSIFPLWWSSFSETMGRRNIYLASFTLFIIFSILSAVSVNISMLIVMRILGGGAAASVQAVGAGTIADIWEPRERGRAMGLFYLGPLSGPLLAPIIGGVLTEWRGWRSNMWFLVIFGGVLLLLIVFGLPETLAKRAPLAPPEPPADLTRVSTAQSVKRGTKRAAVIAKRLFVDPLMVLSSLRFPAVMVSVYLAAIAFGSLFILNISIQAVFSTAPYGFSTIIVGLLYLPPSLGYATSSLVGGRWIDSIMAREARKAGRYDANGKLIYLPEDRMKENIWLASTLYPAALIWYGWTADKGVHWIVPCIANFFFGFGSMLVFSAVTTMLTEFMPKRSSSGVAVNNFIRNIFSCVGGIVAEPLLKAMGTGWLCTMIGLVAFVTGNLAVLALKTWAPKWRISMDRKLNGQAAS
ncbi:MFS general substrate transporter [Thozetella sp. PMI_491]|nr:MFS general substrate transporter [Thozetella sp. PMI_491]